LSLLSRSWLERLFLDVVRNEFGSIDLNGLGAWLQIESVRLDERRSARAGTTNAQRREMPLERADGA
jgi:hypothetical protein